MQHQKIVSIKKIPRRDRYDLTINSTHNFFANNILIHNTSSIFSNVLVKKKSLWIKLLKFLRFPVLDTEYKFLSASRTVIKTENKKSGFYATDIWSLAGEHFKDRLRKGESVYAEIVGYMPDGKMIQKGYRYGLLPNNYKVLVYRITQTDLDGNVIEHGWASMKERCAELFVEHVPEIYFGRLCDLYPDIAIDENWHQNLAERLKKDFLEKTREDCDGLPDEGIVIRKEGAVIDSFKLKSDLFFAHETKVYEKGEADIEEQESSEISE